MLSWGVRRVGCCSQGVGWAFDFIQQRMAESEDGAKRLRGYGVNATYDWEMLGAAFGVEVDYVAHTESLYVGLNAFSGGLLPPWRLLPLLLLLPWRLLLP